MTPAELLHILCTDPLGWKEHWMRSDLGDTDGPFYKSVEEAARPYGYDLDGGVSKFVRLNFPEPCPQLDALADTAMYLYQQKII